MTNIIHRKIDICYCKKKFYNDDEELIFEEGKYYTFFFEDDDYVWVTYNPNGPLMKEGRRFHLDKTRPVKMSFLYHFYTYFCSLKEIRKIKLNKLNEEK